MSSPPNPNVNQPPMQMQQGGQQFRPGMPLPYGYGQQQPQNVQYYYQMQPNQNQMQPAPGQYYQQGGPMQMQQSPMKYPEPDFNLGMNTATPSSVVMPYLMPPLANYDGPTGLEMLIGISSMSMKQELELLEIFIGIETNNRYSVFNNFGQPIYFCGEDTDPMNRCFMGVNRPFTVRVFDATGRHVMNVQRQCTAALCWWGGAIAGSNVTITSALTNELYGSLVQNCNPCQPSFDLLGPDGTKVMEIQGPTCGSFCPCVMCCNAQFDVFAVGIAQPLGTIMKRFTLPELISDANVFGMSFPSDLDVRLKATLLGAILSIDFSFFEGDPNNSCSCTPGCCKFITAICILIIIILSVMYSTHSMSSDK